MSESPVKHVDLGAALRLVPYFLAFGQKVFFDGW